MTRNRTKVWDLNYVTVIMSTTTKPITITAIRTIDSGLRRRTSLSPEPFDVGVPGGGP